MIRIFALLALLTSCGYQSSSHLSSVQYYCKDGCVYHLGTSVVEGRQYTVTATFGDGSNARPASGKNASKNLLGADFLKNDNLEKPDFKFERGVSSGKIPLKHRLPMPSILNPENHAIELSTKLSQLKLDPLVNTKIDLFKEIREEFDQRLDKARKEPISSAAAQDFAQAISRNLEVSYQYLHNNAAANLPTINKTSRELTAHHNQHNKALFASLDEQYRWDEWSDQNYPYRTSGQTPEGQRLFEAKTYLNYTRSVIERQNSPYQAQREAMVDYSDATLQAADEFYQTGQIESGDSAVRLATDIADMALSLTPGIGWGKDIYESFSGKNLLTGEKLSSIDRVFAIAGMLSVGIGSKIGQSFKIFKKIANSGVKGVAKLSSKDIETLSQYEEILAAAESITKYGPLNKGPLHILEQGSYIKADTFRSSSYFEVITDKPVDVYRVFDKNGRQIGEYYTTIKPTGPLQASIDFALIPEFGNNAVNWLKMRIPPGEKIYIGPAAAQKTGRQGVDQIFLGGGPQVYFKNGKAEWIIEEGKFN